MLDAISTAVYGCSKQSTLRLLRSHTAIADSTDIYLLDDNYVVHVSQPDFPNSADNEARKMRAMRTALKDAASVVPAIIADGTVDGRSFLALPLLRPLRQGGLRGKLDRIRFRKKVVDWALQVATLGQPTSAEARLAFATSLKALNSVPGISQEIASAASRIDSEKARFVPMHGDLWVANIMRQRSSIFIIDWGGAEPQGYGVYDLIRAAESFRLSRRSLSRELTKHSAILGGTEALELHLLGALGHYAQNLGEFPLPNFLNLADRCWIRFTRSIGSG